MPARLPNADDEETARDMANAIAPTPGETPAGRTRPPGAGDGAPSGGDPFAGLLAMLSPAPQQTPTPDSMVPAGAGAAPGITDRPPHLPRPPATLQATPGQASAGDNADSAPANGRKADTSPPPNGLAHPSHASRKPAPPQVATGGTAEDAPPARPAATGQHTPVDPDVTAPFVRTGASQDPATQTPTPQAPARDAATSAAPGPAVTGKPAVPATPAPTDRAAAQPGATAAATPDRAGNANPAAPEARSNATPTANAAPTVISEAVRPDIAHRAGHPAPTQATPTRTTPAQATPTQAEPAAGPQSASQTPAPPTQPQRSLVGSTPRGLLETLAAANTRASGETPVTNRPTSTGHAPAGSAAGAVGTRANTAAPPQAPILLAVAGGADALQFAADGIPDAYLPTTGERAADITTPHLVRASTPLGGGASLPTAQIALAMVREARAGTQRFEIRLDPPELGRIDVRLELSRDGTLNAHLTVDRPETLDALNRDARHLERALQQSGLKLEGGDIQFSLRDDGDAQQRDAAPDQPWSAQVPDGDDDAPDTLAAYRALSPAALVDIQV